MGLRAFGWNAHFSWYHPSTYVHTPPPTHTHTHTHTPVTEIILPMSHDRGIVLLCSSGQTNKFENRMWTCCLATWKEEGDNQTLKLCPVLQTKVEI